MLARSEIVCVMGSPLHIIRNYNEKFTVCAVQYYKRGELSMLFSSVQDINAMGMVQQKIKESKESIRVLLSLIHYLTVLKIVQCGITGRAGGKQRRNAVVSLSYMHYTLCYILDFLVRPGYCHSAGIRRAALSRNNAKTTITIT